MTHPVKLHMKLTIFLVVMEIISSSALFDSANFYDLLTPDERLQIFNTDDKQEIPKYDVISINWPKVHKRSVDGIISLPLKAFNKTITLSLKSAIPLVGPKTAIYIARTVGYRQVHMETNYPFERYFTKLYEDEAQRASFIVNADSNGIHRIEAGIIGSQKLSLHRVPDRLVNNENGSSNSTDKENYYVISSINDIVTSHHDTVNFLGFSFGDQVRTIPGVVYPELLIICDHSFTRKFEKVLNAVDYLLNFWNRVDMTYRTMDAPKYKLSIAGFILSMDNNAFEFITPTMLGNHLDFSTTLNSAGLWLYKNQKIIPIESYDIAMIQTATTAGTFFSWLSMSQKLGEAYLGGACKSEGNTVQKVGIIYDDHNYAGSIPATHEVAHLLGVPHDGETGCFNSDYIMAPAIQSSPNRSKWSRCSIQSFRQFLGDNARCLFNVPEQYQEIPSIAKKSFDLDNTDVNNNGFNNVNNNHFSHGFNNNRNNENTNNLDDVITGTNIKYSQLNPDKALAKFKILNIPGFTIDPRVIPPNTIMLVQILQDGNALVYLLEAKK